MKGDFQMFEKLKDLLLAGVGGAAISVEKADEVVTNLVKKGKLTVDEGKDFSEELIKKAKGSTGIGKINQEELQATLIELNFAQQQDIDVLETQIQSLQAELNELKDELAKEN